MTSRAPDKLGGERHERDAAAPLAEQMRRDGVVVVRDAFTAEQIAELREICVAHLRRHGLERKGGLHEPFPNRRLPGLDWVWSHPPIVDALEVIAGGRPIRHSGGDIHMSQFLGWHKDLGVVPDGTFPVDHFASDEFAIYKVGIYLQDHLRRAGRPSPIGRRLRELYWRVEGEPEKKRLWDASRISPDY